MHLLHRAPVLVNNSPDRDPWDGRVHCLDALHDAVQLVVPAIHE